MGVYATLEGKTKSAQVKLWRLPGLPTFKFGDEVPEFEGHQSYSIELREGGYAIIRDCRFVALSGTPVHYPIFDKSGRMWVEGQGWKPQTHESLYKTKDDGLDWAVEHLDYPADWREQHARFRSELDKHLKD